MRIDVVSHQPELTIAVVKLINQIVTPLEYFGINNLVHFFFGMNQLSLHIQKLLVLTEKKVFVL